MESHHQDGIGYGVEACGRKQRQRPHTVRAALWKNRGWLRGHPVSGARHLGVANSARRKMEVSSLYDVAVEWEAAGGAELVSAALANEGQCNCAIVLL